MLNEEEIRDVGMGVPTDTRLHINPNARHVRYTFLDLHVGFAPDTRSTSARLSHVVKDRLMEAFPQIADAIIHIEPPPTEDTAATS